MDRFIAVAGVAAAAVVGVFLLWPASASPPVVSLPPAMTTSATVTVHVSGSVARPGLVSVPAGSRVADVILAAGGALPGAVLGSLNLAAPVSEGQQLVVPDASMGVATPGDGRIRLNSADASALEMLPGVGPVLAARIVEYRDRNGPFLAVEDLLDVPGIGEAKLEALRESVMVP